MCISHVPHMNESRPIYEWVIEQVSKGNTARGSHMNESRPTQE